MPRSLKKPPSRRQRSPLVKRLPPQDLDALVDPDHKPRRHANRTEASYLAVIQKATELGLPIKKVCEQDKHAPTINSVYVAAARWPAVKEALADHRLAMSYMHEAVIEDAALSLMDPELTAGLSSTQIRAIEAGIKSHQWLAESRNPAVFANRHAATAAVQVNINTNALGDDSDLEPQRFSITVPRKEEPDGQG